MWELGLGHVCAEHPERQEGADGLHTSGVVSSCIFYFFVGTKWSGGCDGFGGVPVIILFHSCQNTFCKLRNKTYVQVNHFYFLANICSGK